MQTIEAEVISSSTAVTCPASLPGTPATSCEAMRFNAMKHGILSRLVVLAHEDSAEFADLFAALLDAHRPAGMTERHLIGALATIIWRKRRVLLAERAKINEGLKNGASSSKSGTSSAAPFERGGADENTDVRDLLDLPRTDIAENRKSAAPDLAATRKAAAMLRKGGQDAYAKTRQAQIQDFPDYWDEHVEEQSDPPAAEGPTESLRETVEPICVRMGREARFAPAIKAQTVGEGLQAHRVENLNRYETRRDRRFERTLTMRLKLKDLRSAWNPTATKPRRSQMEKQLWQFVRQQQAQFAK